MADIIVAGKREDPGSFGISNFVSSINGMDTLPNHSFLVTFAPFSSDQKKTSSLLNQYLIGGPANSRITIRCDSVVLPSPVLYKEEIKRHGYGPQEEMPYDIQFGSIQLSVLVDGDGNQLKFFHDWMSIIVNFRSFGAVNMVSDDPTSGMNPYEVSYKDDFANRQMNINVYDRKLDRIFLYEVYDVFPTDINPPIMSWNSVDQLFRLNVRLAYTDYTLKTPKTDAIAEEKDTQKTKRNAKKSGVISHSLGGSMGINSGGGADPISIQTSSSSGNIGTGIELEGHSPTFNEVLTDKQIA